MGCMGSLTNQGLGLRISRNQGLGFGFRIGLVSEDQKFAPTKGLECWVLRLLVAYDLGSGTRSGFLPS